MNASLNEKLGTVKWGEFKYKEVFNRIEQGRRLKKDDQIDGTIPFVMSGTTNAGVVNYISNPVASFPKNAITIDIFGNTFYRNYAFGAGDDTGVYWNDATAYSSNAMLFFAVAMQKSMMGRFSYGKKLRSSQSEDFTMHLPVTDDGAIDFDFMESFIAELEAERVAELEAERVAELSAYLTVSGLDNYELSNNEMAIIERYKKHQIPFSEFEFIKIFNNIKQGRRLKKDDQLPGDIPFVMSGTTNTGVIGYISNPVARFPKNSITIDIFGNSFYRNYDFGAGDDTGVYWNTEKEYSRTCMLFFAAAMGRALRGKYSYGKKLRSSQSIHFKMQLPTKDGKPDYDAMAALISAVQKLVIKDVVLYADRKIEKTKDVTKR